MPLAPAGSDFPGVWPTFSPLPPPGLATSPSAAPRFAGAARCARRSISIASISTPSWGSRYRRRSPPSKHRAAPSTACSFTASRSQTSFAPPRLRPHPHDGGETMTEGDRPPRERPPEPTPEPQPPPPPRPEKGDDRDQNPPLRESDLPGDPDE